MTVNKNDFDFSGYATRVGVKCTDGRTILKDAFQHNDGDIVPLVWQHLRNEPSNILGHALLENRPDGVYAYCSLNHSEAAEQAKITIAHHDIKALSIYANELVERANNVMHGAIKEVSLVVAGANAGAFIDNIAFQHSDGSSTTDDTEAIISFGEPLNVYNRTNIEHADNEGDDMTIGDVFDTLTDVQKDVVYALIGQVVAGNATSSGEGGVVNHSDGSEETVADVFDTLSEKQKTAVYIMIEKAVSNAKGGAVKHSDVPANGSEETVADVFDTLSEKQKTAVYIVIEKAVSDAKAGIKHSGESEGDSEFMKTNVFNNQNQNGGARVLSHSDMQTIVANAQRVGSLKEAVLQHAGTFGIDNIDVLFPDAVASNKSGPVMLKRKTEWVGEVFDKAYHSPFSRIKTLIADITADEARAKGYTKGNLKVDEVIAMLKRVTTPTTVYKKQKLDRDDIVDITDMDIVSWLKREMRVMLDEELARAVLVGDGRLISSDDKISETNIRPIYSDDPLYSVRTLVDTNGTTSDIIDAMVLARKDYQGSGNPVLFTTPDVVGDMLLLKDTTGRRIYKNMTDLAAALRVSKVVEVPVMEGIERVVSGSDGAVLLGIIVNMNDYYIGADKGGRVSMFDDFDIDYNQQKYLIETRVSGALVLPHSALVIEQASVIA